MKKLILSLLLFIGTGVFMNVQAQEEIEVTDSTLHVVVKNDGTEYVGYILKKDGREVLVRTLALGDLYIPMHEVASITEAKNAQIAADGTYSAPDAFGTRYFLTTNALALDKGETYAVMQWWGPEVHYGATDRLGVGVMTSWIAIPIVIDLKYTIPLADDGKTNLAFGALLGTGSYGALGSFGAMPFASLTFGDKNTNFSVTGGGVWGTAFGETLDWQPLASIAGMSKITPKITFVFDSFIVLPTGGGGDIFAFVTPGLRFQTNKDRSFQFGFTGLAAEGEVIPVPIPMVSWFYKL